jgi:hypothetical protein
MKRRFVREGYDLLAGTFSSLQMLVEHDKTTDNAMAILQKMFIVNYSASLDNIIL